MLFFAGFGAMLLAGVLFLTGVWHEPVLTAGLMLFPGPATATAFSVPSARLGARFGYRLPGTIGALIFAAGSVWYITQTGDHPAYFSEYLPGAIISGAGVGLVIPTLTGAGASSLAPERFATGAAILTMGRQIGAALGVAILVPVLGASRDERGGLPQRLDDHGARRPRDGGRPRRDRAARAHGRPRAGRQASASTRWRRERRRGSGGPRASSGRTRIAALGAAAAGSVGARGDARRSWPGRYRRRRSPGRWT